MSATAELIFDGHRQSVRLPEEFRLPGKEVRVSRIGNTIVLAPIEEPGFDVDAFWARLDAAGAAEFLVEGVPDDPPVEPDHTVGFD